MKRILVLFSLLASVVSCNKENENTRYDELKNIVSHIVGTYNTREVCGIDGGLGGSLFYFDTTYNVKVIITSVSDTAIIVNGLTLFFAGNLDTKNYYFTYSHLYYSFTIDSTLNNITYNGFGGATVYGGCTYTGHK